MYDIPATNSFWWSLKESLLSAKLSKVFITYLDSVVMDYTILSYFIADHFVLKVQWSPWGQQAPVVHTMDRAIHWINRYKKNQQ